MIEFQPSRQCALFVRTHKGIHPDPLIAPLVMLGWGASLGGLVGEAKDVSMACPVMC